MNLFQKIAALFGAEYVVQVCRESASVRRVVKLGKYWVFEHDSTRLSPAGRIHGIGCGAWEPLTKRVRRYFHAEVV